MLPLGDAYKYTKKGLYFQFLLGCFWDMVLDIFVSPNYTFQFLLGCFGNLLFYIGNTRPAFNSF